jgi:NAD(P)-dependent dehydrogenase (short-subunit alcohol dehydrogenase family)
MDVHGSAALKRVVVITGGTRGMGRAFTLAFLAAGAQL